MQNKENYYYSYILAAAILFINCATRQKRKENDIESATSMNLMCGCVCVCVYATVECVDLPKT